MTSIVADSGPLIAFARSHRLDLLQQVAGSIVVPATVYAECVHQAEKPGAAALIEARAAGRLDVREDSTAGARLGTLPVLGAGEIAALAMALELGCPLLMDERLGRRVAALHGIPVVGSAGILLAAKDRGLIAEVAPILAAWRAWGYFLSPLLVEVVLRRAGERRQE